MAADSRDMAAFLMKAAAMVVRLNQCGGPDDEPFRRLAIADMVDGIPLLDPWDGLREQLQVGQDPVTAVSDAFAAQAVSYSEAAATACVGIVERAVEHLHALGGDDAVAAFLSALQGQEDEPAA